MINTAFQQYYIITIYKNPLKYYTTKKLWNPVLIDKMEYIVSKAKSKNINIGTFVDQIDNIKRWKDTGIKYLSYSVDVVIFFGYVQINS